MLSNNVIQGSAGRGAGARTAHRKVVCSTHQPFARRPRATELGLTGQECLLRALARVPDPRDARGVRHRLPAVMAMSIAAVLAGTRSF